MPTHELFSRAADAHEFVQDMAYVDSAFDGALLGQFQQSVEDGTGLHDAKGDQAWSWQEFDSGHVQQDKDARHNWQRELLTRRHRLLEGHRGELIRAEIIA